MRTAQSIYVPELPDEVLEYLRLLGLSDHELQLYTVMAAKRCPMSAQDVAGQLMVFPNAVYRMFEALEEKNLIRFVAKRPIRYEVIARENGLRAAYSTHVHDLAGLLGRAIGGDLTGTTDTGGARLIVGRESMYREYMKLAHQAQKTIDVFAIGIAFSDDLHHVQREAIARGVYIRHVVQELQPANYHIVSKWQRLGVSVRHYREERGFHITIIDGLAAMITFSDPANTVDRLSLVLNQAFAVRLFQAQFESIWQQAKVVDNNIK
ncbi:MAG: helix-turn-helix domain-containing protein [Candidatus Saccharimonadales bacterium]